MPIDWTKPIQTTDGRKAEFVRRLGRAPTREFLVIIQEPGGAEWVIQTDETGRWAGLDAPSVENTREKSAADLDAEELTLLRKYAPDPQSIAASSALRSFYKDHLDRNPWKSQ